jgi:type IX secretion system PorP/SprF family membrane protein
MNKQPGGNIVFILITLIISLNANSQEYGSGPDYQMTMLSNPGLTGAEGDGYIRLSYLNHYPGNNYNLHSLHFSYDSYFPALHGGAGFFVSNDYMGGIVNNLRSGFSYAYFFQAGSNLFIAGGLSASLYHRGYNFGGAVLPDQINPVGGISLPSGEILSDRGRNVLDLGTGFLFITTRFLWGISVSHLTEPDISNTEASETRLNRRLLLHIAGDFNISEGKNLKIRPLAVTDLRRGYFSAGAGAVLESKYLSASLLLLTDNENNFDLQPGFSVSAGNLVLFYNYRFNIIPGNNLLPFSLLHRTGIALSLNNVDKRKSVKTINFPKL